MNHDLQALLIEAMLALTEGLRKFGSTDAKRAGDVADAADRAFSSHKRLTKNDPAFATLYNEVSQLLAASNPTSGSKLFWKEGNEFFNQKKYGPASEAFNRARGYEKHRKMADGYLQLIKVQQG